MNGPEDWGGTDPVDYAIGDVIGHRAWVVKVEPRSWLADRFGRAEERSPVRVALQSVYRPYLWHPGENVAVCVPGSGHPHGMSASWPSIPKVKTSLCRREHDSHSTANPQQPECTRLHLSDQIDPSHTCGFYAYTENITNTYQPSGGGIEGLVQGYGLTTIGSKGFRCSKARLIALVRPGVRARPPQNARMLVERAFCGSADWDRVAAHWGVPLFESMADAVDAFPLGVRSGRLVMRNESS